MWLAILYIYTAKHLRKKTFVVGIENGRSYNECLLLHSELIKNCENHGSFSPRMFYRIWYVQSFIIDLFCVNTLYKHMVWCLL